MRTETINTITVTYPDENVWLGDSTFIEIDAPDYMHVGADITVRQEATGVTRRLRHVSELHHIVFSLDDTLQGLYKYGVRTYTVMVTLLDDIFTEGTFSFAFDLFDGKSLPNRSHGAARTFYVYDDEDLIKFQMFTMASGSLNVGGQSFVGMKGYNAFDLRSAVTAYHTTACYANGAKGGGGGGVTVTGVVPQTVSAQVQLSFSDESGEVPEGEKGGGDIWADTKTSNERYCMDIYRPSYCEGFDTFKVRYLDADGLERVMMGKIMEETTETEGDWYRSPMNDGVYRNISRRHITLTKKICKVAFADVAKTAYFSDIAMSPKVWFRNYAGEWVECSLESGEITATSEDAQDYELEFKILEG